VQEVPYQFINTRLHSAPHETADSHYDNVAQFQTTFTLFALCYINQKSPETENNATVTSSPFTRHSAKQSGQVISVTLVRLVRKCTVLKGILIFTHSNIGALEFREVSKIFHTFHLPYKNGSSVYRQQIENISCDPHVCTRILDRNYLLVLKIRMCIQKFPD
jgi:hypothetical protein